jgi:hypothetical protein
LFKNFLFCPCHLCLACLTSKYFSCVFTFQCRQSGLIQQNRLCAAVLDGPDSISSRSAPLHTCTNVFVLHLDMPPHLVPCSVTPDFFFPTVPHLTATILGCVGGSKACFLALQGVPSEGMTLLSCPPHPSPQLPSFKPVLSRVLPSLPRTLHFFPSPFPTGPFFLASVFTLLALFLPCFNVCSLPSRCPSKGKHGCKPWLPCSTTEPRMGRGACTTRSGRCRVWLP